MNYAYIVFWEEDEKPIRITEKEYQQIMKVWPTSEHLVIHGEIIHKKSIKRIRKPEVPEPLGLPEATGTPPSKEFLERMKQEMAKKFTA